MAVRDGSRPLRWSRATPGAWWTRTRAGRPPARGRQARVLAVSWARPRRLYKAPSAASRRRARTLAADVEGTAFEFAAAAASALRGAARRLATTRARPMAIGLSTVDAAGSSREASASIWTCRYGGNSGPAPRVQWSLSSERTGSSSSLSLDAATIAPCVWFPSARRPETATLLMPYFRSLRTTSRSGRHSLLRVAALRKIAPRSPRHVSVMATHSRALLAVLTRSRRPRTRTSRASRKGRRESCTRSRGYSACGRPHAGGWRNAIDLRRSRSLTASARSSVRSSLLRGVRILSPRL